MHSVISSAIELITINCFRPVFINTKIPWELKLYDAKYFIPDDIFIMVLLFLLRTANVNSYRPRILNLFKFKLHTSANYASIIISPNGSSLYNVKKLFNRIGYLPKNPITYDSPFVLLYV